MVFNIYLCTLSEAADKVTVTAGNVPVTLLIQQIAFHVSVVPRRILKLCMGDVDPPVSARHLK